MCALLPPPYHAWGLCVWLFFAFLLSPVRVWRWQFWLLLAVGGGTLLAALVPYPHTAKWMRVMEGIGLAAPTTLAVQPWVTWQAGCLVAVGVLAAIWFFGQVWAENSLKKVLRGVLLLLGVASAVAAVALALGWKHPAFAQEQYFTYLANRNQSATLYAWAVMLGAALWRLEKRALWKQLCVAVALAGLVALALSPSRGGWMTLVAGMAVILSGSRRGVIASAALVVVAAVLVLLGLPGWEARPTTGHEVRPELWANTWQMIRENPLGVGAGNFRYIFPHYQTAYTGEQVVLQPENDWLWAWAELGPLMLMLPAAFFSLGWAKHRRGRIIAGMLAGLAAVSVVDTPLHRLGMWMVVLACVAPVLQVPQVSWRRGALWPSLLPLGLLAALAALHAGWTKPRAQMRESLSFDELSVTRELAARLNRKIPMDFAVYQEWALAELNYRGSKNNAVEAFRKSWALQPVITATPQQAGFAWRPIDAGKAVGAWREALRRAKGQEKINLFGKILREGKLDWESLMGLCARDEVLWTLLMQEARPSDMNALIEGMRRQGMDFWKLQEAEGWAKKALEGSRVPLTFLAAEPTPVALRALYYAKLRDFRQATALARGTLRGGPLTDRYASVPSRELEVRAKLLPDKSSEMWEALAVRAADDKKQYLYALEMAAASREPSQEVVVAYAEYLYQMGRAQESWQQLYRILFPTSPTAE